MRATSGVTIRNDGAVRSERECRIRQRRELKARGEGAWPAGQRFLDAIRATGFATVGDFAEHHGLKAYLLEVRIFEVGPWSAFSARVLRKLIAAGIPADVLVQVVTGELVAGEPAPGSRKKEDDGKA